MCDLGNPLPHVTWNILGENLGHSYSIRRNGNTVANVLRIDRVYRENHGKRLVCEASNLPNTIQLSASVIMDVYRE